MMSVWKPRRVSDLVGAALLALTLTGTVGMSRGAAGPARPVVRATEAVAQDPEIKTWIREDGKWLRTLDPNSVILDAGFRDPAIETVDPDSLKRRWTALAATDSMPALRPVASVLRDRWLDRGYLAVTISRIAGTASGPDTLVVVPQAAWTIASWKIGGDDFPGRDHLIRIWLPSEGSTYRAGDVDLAVDRILEGMGEVGYPFPRWVTRVLRLDPATSTVSIEASLLPGRPSYLGGITSDLEDVRANRFLARSSGLRPGRLFENSELERARDRLVMRDMYTWVGVPEVYLTSAQDTVGVHFPVVPRKKSNRLTVILGLSRREDGSGNRVSGEVDLNLPNMAGTGRKFRIGWRDNGVSRSWFGFRYVEPLAFGTPLDMGLALDNEVQQGSYTRFRLDNTWSVPVVALWGVELGVGWDRSTYPTGSLERTSRTRARGGVQHRRGDRTVSGWEGIFALETAWRSASIRQDTTGFGLEPAQLGEATTQQIFEVDVAGELWMGGTLSLAGRAAFRQLSGGEQTAPLSEQFRFGGANSLRGYREDVFHGTKAAWGSAELRIGRPAGSRLYTFYDLGYFEFWAENPGALDPIADRLRIQGWPRGYGLGIFARTPGGDISLAVGFPGTVDFDLAKLHVTLLESF